MAITACISPAIKTPIVTAGLKWTPEICPKLAAKTIKARPKDNAAAITPPFEHAPHRPIRTNKVVPI